MNPKLTDEQLAKMQADARLRHAKVKKIVKIKQPPKKKARKKPKKKVSKWKLKRLNAEKNFQKKLKLIKERAKKINKAIGMNEYPYWHV